MYERIKHYIQALQRITAAEKKDAGALLQRLRKEQRKGGKNPFIL